MAFRPLIAAMLLVVCPSAAAAQLRAQIFVSGLTLPVGFVQDLDRNGQYDVIVDFGSAFGLWVYFNQAGWGQAHYLSPGPMAFAHMQVGRT